MKNFITGDTFPVGCAFDESNIHHKVTFNLNLELKFTQIITNLKWSINANWIHFEKMQYFTENPDRENPVYDTKNGVYKEGCGLNNVVMSWGHDDYMYLVIHSIISLKNYILMNEFGISCHRTQWRLKN